MVKAVLAQIFSNQYLLNMQILDKRYPDQKLTEFKSLIQAEMKKVQEEVDSIKLRLDDLEHQADSNGGLSFGEDSKNHELRGMLARTYERLVKKQHGLKLALHRIANKTYGIDESTGELIDEQRLRVLLTATSAV
jgi:RNA polymerase-binding transcription factor DksA